MKPKTHRGRLSAEGYRFAIVASRWNDFLTSKLVDGAVEGLESLGAAEDAVEIFMVPGSFELPLTAKKLAESGEKFGKVTAEQVDGVSKMDKIKVQSNEDAQAED